MREGKEHCKAITLRSRKKMESLVQVDENEKETEKAENSMKNSVESEPKKDEVMAPSEEDTPIIPFPRWLKKN